MKRKRYYKLTVLVIVILFTMLSCNKEKKLLKCPEGYDCVDDKIDLGAIFPRPPDSNNNFNPFIQARIDSDSAFSCLLYSGGINVDFSTRTVVGRIYTSADAYDDVMGVSICINNDIKKVIVTAVIKSARKKYLESEGTHLVFYSIPKLPMDYTLYFDSKTY
ncbi:MAG: hypothetical protein WCM76_15455 [Bacteroidota bacterium]